LFNWAMSADIVAASPCAGIERPTKEISCDRVLDDAELALIWYAADELGPPFGPLVKLLLLTGQRRNEVAGLEWKELDLQWWSLPRQRTKNNKAHLVPLSRQAIAVIETIPKISERFVFSTNGETRVSGFGKAKRRLDALLPKDMPPWRLHDLRRTVASGMARLVINLPVIEKVLNHASGSFAGIVGVYQKHEFSDEKRKALEAWGFHVTEIVSKSHL
jgi:integrase